MSDEYVDPADMKCGWCYDGALLDASNIDFCSPRYMSGDASLLEMEYEASCPECGHSRTFNAYATIHSLEPEE